MGRVKFIRHWRSEGLSPRYVYYTTVFFLLILLAGGAASAQSDYGAVLTVSRSGMEMRRVGTPQWFWLRQDAVTAFGVGDELRTNYAGRAYLQFLSAEMVLLPESTLQVLRFSREPEPALHIQITGRALLAVPNAAELGDFRLIGNDVQISTPAQRFGLEVRADAPDYVVVAAGTAGVEVLASGETLTLQENTGFRAQAAQLSPTITIRDVPINFARVEGALDGCAGRVATSGNRLLRVRSGPGDNFFYMGSIPNGSALQLMATSPGPGGLWYRFQFLSGFGWGFGALIDTDCQNLPDFPRDQIGVGRGVVLVQDYEIDVLAPFFGQPEDDVWFYRKLSGSEDE